MRLPLAIALLALAAALAGCGSDDAPAGGERAAERVTLSLDFTPNAVHAPIYAAARDGRDRREGVRLEIRKPGPGPDALKLITAGKVDLGVLDIHDLAIARQQGADLVAIGALVGKPLAALIGQPGLERPRDLEGKTVGVSGLPSDPAFLRAILEHDGADYDSVKQVTIGFSAVARLLSRRVDAVPAFWNAEGVALKARGRDVSEFRVEDYGAPPYPEVVLVTSRRTLEAERETLRRTLKAIAAGMDAALADRDAAAREIADAAESGDTGLTREQLDAVAPVFARGLRLDRAVLERWADFDAEIGIVDQRPDVDRAFDLTLAG
ncbi:MAG TPA: ABC transporter substrate-binding protein [Solirubrobacteraceae bacterium]|nr:ABC transporter substrate-binding protein [Solirubrobacteraceae bacterium]